MSGTWTIAGLVALVLITYLVLRYRNQRKHPDDAVVLIIIYYRGPNPPFDQERTTEVPSNPSPQPPAAPVPKDASGT